MWWRDAVVYQIYVRSFCDSDGDGIGDLPGLTSKLDHLAWLGVDTLWLSPIHPSPNADWGYDVADYTAVHPDYGTLADLDRLIAEAAEREIRIVLDLVPNHTSDQHVWFHDARSARDSRCRDWYVWADPSADGGPPNNWVSSFGGPAWTFDDGTGQYYLHNFLPEQPDLNWWNAEVHRAFEEIHRFWFDRGVAGWRIDVCHRIVKDRELRDNPPAQPDDHWMTRARGQREVYNGNRPEVHDVLRSWRRIADSYDVQRLLLGETWFFDLARLCDYYGGDDELHLAFNIPFVYSSLADGTMRGVVEEVGALFPEHAWPVWTGSNHDAGRFASRWCNGDQDQARCALMLLMTLRGTPVLYYGDEIGMTDVELDREALRDPVGLRFYPAYAGRDPGRTPMQWTGEEGAGFTGPGVVPWLPIGDHAMRNVEDQRHDPSSMLVLCRDLIALRRERADLRSGGYAVVDTPAGAWAYRRGQATLVALNVTGERYALPDVSGTVLIGTRRDRDGELVDGRLELSGAEAVVVATG